MADHNIYVGNDSNKAAQPTKIYIGNPNDKAQLVSKIYVGNSSNKAVQVWPRLKWSDIYQKCEYLYDTNYTEYINTGVYPDSNTRVIIDARKNCSENSLIDRYLFGGNSFGVCWYRTATESAGNHIYFSFSASHTLDYGISYSNWWNDRHVYDFNRSGGHFYIDSTYVGSSTNTFGTLSSPINLWQTTTRNNPDYYVARFYIYSFKAYKNNVLIRDMIPCYRKSDYKPGMYDFANDVFYTNNGTGEFYKGPDVN